MDAECGVDIIEINRIKESIENIGPRFINRIFTLNEIEYCESKNQMKFQHYAARFAAKEAVYKALSSIINIELIWKDIEIINNDYGKPEVFLHNDLEKVKNKLKIDKILISLSHCKEYAVANSFIIKK